MEYNISKAIPVLERTPKLLHTMLSGIDEEWIINNEGGDSWSPYDIVGHLIHGEKTDWMTRIKITLKEEGDKKYSPFDRFAQFENNKGKTIGQLLDEFQEIRTSNLEEFKRLNIQESDMNKTAIHTTFGEVTLKQLLSTWVAHDLGHIAQIARVMAKQYKKEIGPWEQYMSIMHDREN